MQGKPTKTLVLFNALGFNAAWWLCLLGVKWAMPWLGPVAMLLFLAIHFRYLAYGKREFYLLLSVALLGTMVDSTKAFTGLIEYRGGYGIAWLAPLWITAMWVGFAALLNHALGWLRGRYLLAALLGALFGPLSYITGVNFNILEFQMPKAVSIAVLAAVWAVAVPLLFLMSNWIVGRRDYA